MSHAGFPKVSICSASLLTSFVSLPSSSRRKPQTSIIVRTKRRRMIVIEFCKMCKYKTHRIVMIILDDNVS